MGRAVGVAAIAVLVGLAIVIDATVFGPLALPGAPPNLVLLVVTSWALASGPLPGAVLGFLAGLATDIVPPADHLVGRYALVMCIAGYVAGLWREEARDSVPLALLVVAVSVGIGTALYVGSGLVFGELPGSGASALSAALLSVGYDVVLAPFVVPAVLRVARRVAGTRSRQAA